MEIAKFQELEKERNRLGALHKLKILDDEVDPEMDRIVQLASHICGTPISLVNLIDANKTVFKASVGTDLKGSPREISFCSHAIKGISVMEVPDALSDERFAQNPLVTGDTTIRFYAGAPLITNDGYNIGTLCVFDSQPKKLSAMQLEALETLSRQVVLQIELKQIKKKLGKENVLSILTMERTINDLNKKLQLYLPFVPQSLIENNFEKSDYTKPTVTKAALMVCKIYNKEIKSDTLDRIKSLRVYYNIVKSTVSLFKGVIYKYNNEEIHIIFSSPFSLPDFELQATECALEIRSLFSRENDLINTGLCTAIHTGNVITTSFDMTNSIEYIINGQVLDEINSLITLLPVEPYDVVVSEQVLEKIKTNFNTTAIDPEIFDTKIKIVATYSIIMK